LPRIALAALLLCCLCASASATTMDRFRCPNGAIISVNDKLTTVSMRCDPPTMATRRTVATGAYEYFRTIEVEEWVYNQGPTSFVYYLTFENGVLMRIESGEYGN
jgi:hypothetical protein